MSIEIYNKARVIKKDDKYYYFLKYHSKNDCICGGQYTVDDNFNNKYLQRDSFSGSWSVKAIGGKKEYNDQAIHKTFWNCPTSYVYGEIRFGNKKNIALYWAKKKVENYYDFTDEQKENIDNSINWAIGKGKKYIIDLTDIAEKDKFKAVHKYCDDKPITLAMGSKTYKNKIYWDLDNL